MRNPFSFLVKKAVQSWWHAIPMLVGAVVMLPRLISPQFNFEDDGISLQNARSVLAGNYAPILVDFTHRFRPLYWLGYVPLYLIGGIHPLWYFLFNTFILILLAALVVGLVRAWGGSNLQACLAGALFVLSSPVIETFYTVSKPEHIQLFWVLLSLLLVFGRGARGRIGRAGSWLLAAVTVFMALLVKETTLVILPIAAGWFVLAWVFGRRDRQHLSRIGSYIAACLIAGVIYLFLENHYVGGILSGRGYGGHYTLAPGFMIFMSYVWSGWLLRDFLAGLVCLFLGSVLFSKLRKDPGFKLLPASLVWMGGWIAIFLPWDRALDYYLLPFAAGMSIFCGVILGVTFDVLKDHGRARALSIPLLALFLLAILTGLLDNYTSARVELSMDHQQAQLGGFLTSSATGPVPIYVNVNANSTVFSHALALLQIVGNRPDLSLQPFQFETAGPASASKISYYLVTMDAINRPLFSVRTTGDNTKEDGALQAILPSSNKPVFIVQQSFRMIAFNWVNLVCPFVHGGYLKDLYCSSHIPVVDTRVFTIKDQVYRVTSIAGNIDRPAVFQPDGSWEFQLPDGTVRTLHFGRPGDEPLAGDWTGSGETGIGVFDPATLTWSLDDDLDGRADGTFQLHGMTAADVPIAGDWNCSGRDFPGFFRPSDGSWHFWTGDYPGPESLPVLTGTEAGVIPLVGDWNGDGCDTVGIYRPAKGEVNLENRFTADLAGADFLVPKDAIPVVADWAGNGIETLALFNAGTWKRLYANCDCTPANPPPALQFGGQGSIPLAGKWAPAR